VHFLQIELFTWEGEDISPDKDKSITRSIQQEGQGNDIPNEGAQVTVHLTGFHNQRQFMDADFSFVVGECAEAGLPEGIDKAVRRFKKAERSSVHLTPKWGYGKKGSEQYGVPAMADLDFLIELKEFEKVSFLKGPFSIFALLGYSQILT